MSKTRRTLISLVTAAMVAVLSLVSTYRSLARAHPAPQASAPASQDVTQVEQEEAVVPAASETPVEGEPNPAEQEAAEEGQEESEETTDDDREVFVDTWGERIDAFNAGYPLDGYGRTFAEAAYDYNIDPRFSPAIARVESGSGNHCAYSHNAWGWGSYSWPDWETAIYAHVRGLAAAYGYTLSWNAAERYAPEESDDWYGKVDACLYQIWGDDNL